MPIFVQGAQGGVNTNVRNFLFDTTVVAKVFVTVVRTAVGEATDDAEGEEDRENGVFHETFLSCENLERKNVKISSVITSTPPFVRAAVSMGVPAKPTRTEGVSENGALFRIEHRVDLAERLDQIGFELLQGFLSCSKPGLGTSFVEGLRPHHFRQGWPRFLCVVDRIFPGITQPREGGANHLLLTGGRLEAPEEEVEPVAPVAVAVPAINRQKHEGQGAFRRNDETNHFFVLSEEASHSRPRKEIGAAL